MSELIKKISAADFLAQLKSESCPVVIDVRTSAEVASEYLNGCINVPLHEMKPSAISACVDTTSGVHQPVYLLCGTGKRAMMATEKLCGDLPNPLLIIEGGIEALKQAGCELSKGSRTVVSIERQVRIAAGLLVLLGVLLGFFVVSGFYAISAFVGAGLVFAGVSDTCMMGMLLARMPWNSAR